MAKALKVSLEIVLPGIATLPLNSLGIVVLSGTMLLKFYLPLVSLLGVVVSDRILL